MLASDGVWNFLTPQEAIDVVTMSLFECSRVTGIRVPLLGNKTKLTDFSVKEQEMHNIYQMSFNCGSEELPVPRIETLEDIYKAAARAVVMATLCKVGLVKRVRTTLKVLEIEPLWRRQVHDDIAVVIKYL